MTDLGTQADLSRQYISQVEIGGLLLLLKSVLLIAQQNDEGHLQEQYAPENNVCSVMHMCQAE